jgi:hypothetical protein
MLLKPIRHPRSRRGTSKASFVLMVALLYDIQEYILKILRLAAKLTDCDTSNG